MAIDQFTTDAHLNKTLAMRSEAKSHEIGKMSIMVWNLKHNWLDKVLIKEVL